MRYSILMLCLCLSGSLFACDFCNCYMGLNPHDRKNSIGIRYRYMPATGSHHDPRLVEAMGLKPGDFREYHTEMELYGQFYPARKLRVDVKASYSVTENQQPAMNGVSDGHTHTHGDEADPHGGNGTIRGMGDPVALALYELVDQVPAGDGKFMHRLYAGMGLKFPFGKYRSENGDVTDYHHQPGTGSWDLLAAMSYVMRISRFGININGNYLFTSESDEGIRYANRLNINGLLFHEIRLGNHPLYPSAGLFYERAGRDRIDGTEVSNSGGRTLYIHTGMDYYLNNFAIHLAWQWPAALSLNLPQAEPDYRFIAGLSYAFQFK